MGALLHTLAAPCDANATLPKGVQARGSSSSKKLKQPTKAILLWRSKRRKACRRRSDCAGFQTRKKKTASVKVVDSRPARSARRVKRSCFKTLENFCVCYEGSALSSKVLKIHPVFHADEFSISKNTRNAKLTKNMAKTSFLKLVIVFI